MTVSGGEITVHTLVEVSVGSKAEFILGGIEIEIKIAEEFRIEVKLTRAFEGSGCDCAIDEEVLGDFISAVYPEGIEIKIFIEAKEAEEFGQFSISSYVTDVQIGVGMFRSESSSGSECDKCGDCFFHMFFFIPHPY